VTSSTPDALWGAAPALRVLRPSAITVSNLSRGGVLDRCSLRIPVGTRLLVVSEPARGASTLLRILAGLSRPDGGRIEIAGLADPSRSGWGGRAAYLGPEPGIHRWMTPREALTLAAGLLNVAPEDAARRIERAMAWARIPAAAADRPVGRGGSPLIQRTGLAAALVTDPEVLLLDEPLRAIETGERARLPGQRHTIVVASRYPASEAGLVTHVALLRDGRPVLLAPVDALTDVGLPLSMRGIEALAAARSARPAEAS
jgi:ABC-type multidrug transport system ATPase subunit